MNQAIEKSVVGAVAGITPGVRQNLRICKTENEEVCLYDGGNWYRVRLTECDSAQKLMQQIFQLSGQGWFTMKHLHLFLAQVFSQFPKLAPPA